MHAMPAPTPVVSVHPITLSAPDRGEDLQVRISAPTTGHELPVIVFSHGFGQSATNYDPLADFWASHGFVVIQPTHLDSRTLNLPPDDPRTPLIWKFRVDDLKRTLDQLDLLESSVPGLAGRLDRTRIAVAGHSWGAQTASTLLGARVLDADGNPGEDMSDPRIKAGVLLAVTGTGGADLSPFAAEHFPFMSPSFADMTTPALVVAGDQDDSPLAGEGRKIDHAPVGQGVLSRPKGPAATHDAVAALDELTIDKIDPARLVPRMWELRGNITAYDAAYVATAELLGCPLLTGDRRLARSRGVRCVIRVVHDA